MSILTSFRHGFYRHALAPASRINGGGEEFAFLAKFSNPVYMASGPSVRAGVLRPTAPGSLSLRPVGTNLGIPQGTGTFVQEEPEDLGYV